MAHGIGIVDPAVEGPSVSLVRPVSRKVDMAKSKQELDNLAGGPNSRSNFASYSNLCTFPGEASWLDRSLSAS